MHRSSNSIAALAAALAKAQAELINPEKTLVATIRNERQVEKSFRYAPLSSGLEIVRKPLGQDDIDAPDLNARVNEYKNEGMNGAKAWAAQPRRRPGEVKAVHVHKPVLDHDASARLREQLMAEMKSIPSPDAAADWVARILSAKNTLTAADARLVEDAFQSIVTNYQTGVSEETDEPIS